MLNSYYLLFYKNWTCRNDATLLPVCKKAFWSAPIGSRQRKKMFKYDEKKCETQNKYLDILISQKVTGHWCFSNKLCFVTIYFYDDCCIIMYCCKNFFLIYNAKFKTWKSNCEMLLNTYSNWSISEQFSRQLTRNATVQTSLN